MLETYAELIPGADIVAHSIGRHSADFYAAWLADPQITIWIAETATAAAIGYLVLTPATVPEPNPSQRDLEIQRIYVLSRFHAQSIGYRLMRQAIETAEARKARQLVLGVLKKNENAVAFYRRQGFSEIGSRTFLVGTATFNDHVMGRPIT